MRNRFGRFVAAAVASAAIVSVSMVLILGQGAQTKAPAPAPASRGAQAPATPAAPARGQAAPARGTSTPRVQRIDGKPNFNGLWQAMNMGNWDIQDHSAMPGPYPALLGAWGAQPAGLSIVENNEIPYKPEALAKKKANYASRLKIDPYNIHTTGDPEAKCYAPGVPRAMYMPYPFQILQMSDKILMVFGYSNVSRFIQLENHQEAPIDLWMGWSNGKWEGDTLVVDVTGLNGRSWLDSTGQFFSANTRLVERWKLVDANTIDYEVTFEDPTIYTRPWKINFAKRRAGTGPTGGPRGVTAASSLPPSATKDPYASESWERACYEGNTESMQGMRALGYKWFSGITPPQ